MQNDIKIINLPTDDAKVYRHFLRFMNFGMKREDTVGLTLKEIEVLAEFVRLNNEYSALPEDKRAKFIFSTDMRKEVISKLDMDDSALNNILSRLRKATFLGQPILSKENIILEDLLFTPSEEGYTIQVNLIKQK